MKVILTEDVPNLGVLGDQVQVKPGYARNFLIPKGQAILASSKKSKELKHRMQFFQKLREEAITSANSEAAKLVALQLEITKKSGLGGRLFGSVTNKDIAELLQKNEFAVPRRNIIPYEPIKTVGTHRVSVKLHTEVKVDINIKVVGETTEAKATLEAQATAEEVVAQETKTDAPVAQESDTTVPEESAQTETSENLAQTEATEETSETTESAS